MCRWKNMRKLNMFMVEIDDLTPLEAISHGGVVVSGIPTFPTHKAHCHHVLIHMAAVFHDFSRRGFTEGMAGQISVRDPEFENYIWMNQSSWETFWSDDCW
ncbi:hypothetical protein EAF04_002778 [Stromatinia cepivora]|nr:hypothetical protein EAF04_002778 [Stromatinia cepivora]